MKKEKENNLKETLALLTKYITEDCYDNESKKIYFEEAIKVLVELKSLQG